MKQTNELFKKQMTRKEFLQFVGLAILGVLGLKNFITFLMEQTQLGQKTEQPKQLANQAQPNGFGSSKFGV